LYGLCTGREPFAGATLTAVLTALAVDTPTPVNEINDDALAALVMRMLEKDPRRRPKSMQRIAEVLARIERNPKFALASAATSRTQVIAPLASRGRRTPKPAKRASRRPLAALSALALAALLGLLGLAAVAVKLTRQESPSPTASSTPVKEVPLLELKRVDQQEWPHVPPRRSPNDPPPGTVQVRGVTSPNGIFMHPSPRPGAVASLSVEAGKRYRTFETQVSLNDGPRGGGPPVTFWVYGDGQLLWKSKPIHGQWELDRCQVSVENVNVLRIAVTCEGEPFGMHAVWIEPLVK